MIHNPLHRIAKMLAEIASYDPRAEVTNLPLSKAFKGFRRDVRFVYWNSRVLRVRDCNLPRRYLRDTGFMPWYIWSDRLGMVIGRGHTLERCAMATVRHLRSGKLRPR